MAALEHRVIDIAYKAIQEVGSSEEQQDWTPYFREMAAEQFIDEYKNINDGLFINIGGDEGFMTTLTLPMVTAVMRSTIETNVTAMELMKGKTLNESHKAINELYSSYSTELGGMIKIEIQNHLAKGINYNGTLH